MREYTGCMDWNLLLQIDWQSLVDYLAVGIGAITGALAYVVLMLLCVPQVLASAACVAVAFALALLSRRFNWRTRSIDN